ncbi:MAG: CcmD family protein [Spirochaetia bacterium]|jgi:CcmD family protein|nr:CcmD family protein [Spirochaetia bacterium]
MNKLKKTVSFLLLSAALFFHPLFADTPLETAQNEESADNGALWNVLLIVLVVWLGLAAYLFRIDRKISKIERELHEE